MTYPDGSEKQTQFILAGPLDYPRHNNQQRSAQAMIDVTKAPEHNQDEDWEVRAWGSTDDLTERFITSGGGAHMRGGCGNTKKLWWFGFDQDVEKYKLFLFKMAFAWDKMEKWVVKLDGERCYANTPAAGTIVSTYCYALALPKAQHTKEKAWIESFPVRKTSPCNLRLGWVAS